MAPSTNTLPDLLEQARASWPKLTLDGAGFASHLERHRKGEGELRVGDLFLAWACAQADAQALAEFDRHFIDAEAPNALRRLRLTEAMVDEVKQLLRQRLLVSEGGRVPRIADYSGRGPLSTWVRVAAVRIALNLGRQQRRLEKAEVRAVPELLAVADPELALLRGRYGDELKRAVHDAFAALGQDHKTLLRLHYVDRLSLEALSTLYRLGRSTVARRIAEAKEKVVAETRRLLIDRLKLDPDELESLLRLLRSQIDVSIQSLLAAD